MFQQRLLAMGLVAVLVELVPFVAPLGPRAVAEGLAVEDGYRGIWYFNQPTDDEYRYKYSGGFATYPQQHAPIAIYCPQVAKTFSFDEAAQAHAYIQSRANVGKVVLTA